MAINYVIQFKRQHSMMWEQVNPILKMGEPGFESDTGRVKIGDGIKQWNDLGYLSLNKSDDGVILETDIGTVTTDMLATRSVTGEKIELATIDDSHIDDNAEIDVSKLSGVVAKNNGKVLEASTTSSVVRNMVVSTQPPSGGADGDVWMVYVP